MTLQRSSGSTAAATKTSARYEFDQWKSRIGRSAASIRPGPRPQVELDGLDEEHQARDAGDRGIEPAGARDRPEGQRDEDGDDAVDQHLAGDDRGGAHHRQHRDLGRGVVGAVAERQRPGVRRGPEEDDREQHERRQRDVAGDGRPADQRREAAGDPAPDDVLRRAPLEQQRVDEDVERVGAEGEPRRQPVRRRGRARGSTATPRTAPNTVAARGPTRWRGRARRRVRRIRSSMSRSSTQLKTLALAAAKQPPTMVSRTSTSGGTPRAARNIAGTVVTSSSSMIRGLVRLTYAETTSRAVTDPAAPASALLRGPTRLRRRSGRGWSQVKLSHVGTSAPTPRHVARLPPVPEPPGWCRLRR